MPTRSAYWSLILAVPALYVGCGSTAPRPAHTFSASAAGGRAQRLAMPRGSNPFVGDWGPISSYVANDWTARFTSDGRMSIQGPGLTARGYYLARGLTAEVNYRWRDGLEPTETNIAHATYRLSPTGELTFSTGLPNDPPVHLRMTR